MRRIEGAAARARSLPGATYARDVPHLSVAQLKMYLRCPLQYFFRYVCHLKVPPTGDLALGRAVHDALRDNYRQKIRSHRDLPVSDATDIYSDHWERGVKEAAFQDGEDSGKLKDQGVALLKAYFQEVAPTIQPLEVERRFLVDTKATKLPILGYIDLVDDGGLIIDHKTAKKSYADDAAQKDVQLTAYAMAYRAIHGRPEKGVRLDVMVKNKQPKIQRLRGRRTRSDIGRFLRLAKELERGIDSGVYYPNEGYTCGICGYQGMCERW